jgi:integrase
VGCAAGELMRLTVDHLDLDRCGLHLDSAWTKNRKSGFRPLPAHLVRRLTAFAASGEALSLYRKHYRRKNCKREVTERPLLYVPQKPAVIMEKDFKRAGIKKSTPGARLIFMPAETPTSPLHTNAEEVIRMSRASQGTIR